MRWSIVSLVFIAPLLTNCGGGDVALQRQNLPLMVAPDAVVLSVSAPASVPFAMTDSASGAGTISVSQGTCGSIASLGSPADSHGVHVMTIGSNPGVQVGGSGSGYSLSPLAPGKCTVRISDALGNVATIFVTVTP